MQLTIGFSPCPNDTFMMDALIHQRISTWGITWNTEMEDVETLNKWALEGRLDVTKLSFHAWLRVQDTYTLLSSGAALGHGCGPLVISKRPLSEQELLEGPVAIPGQLTTANLLFSLRYPHAQNKQMMLFSDIESAILNDRVRAGVIIHENRFTYQQKGLMKILDLGDYWERETGSPIPLGAFAAKKTLGHEQINKIEALLRESISYAFEHRETAMPFVREYAQELDEHVIQEHINTYVNEYSLDIGNQGFSAIQTLHLRARQAGLI